MARRARLKLTIQWDEHIWLANDDVWAWAHGATPEEAARACVAEAREFLRDCGDGSDLAGPAAQQYDTYRRFFAQAPAPPADSAPALGDRRTEA